jgi:DNA-binding IclR family transcriptional regulator
MAGTAIPALERGLDVLEHLSASPLGATATELIEATRVPRATLYRIVAVLAARGLITAGPATPPRYVLGPALVRLARDAPPQIDLVSAAQQVMDALAASLGETIKLVVRVDTEALTIAISHSGNHVPILSKVGTRLPLHLGASQRLLLSRAPPAILEAVAKGPMERRASRTITNPRLLRREVKALRDRNWAATESEGIEGLGAVAALINDASGSAQAALVAVYIRGRKTTRRLREIRDATIQAAEEISRRLGAAAR